MMHANLEKSVRYLGLQIKRVLRYFPAVFSITILLVGMVCLLAGGVISDKLSDDSRKMIKLGAVGDISDSYLGIGIYALKQLDPSRFAIEIYEMSEAEAREKLISGELTAYFVLPDGFVDSVVSGENLAVTYYTSNGQAGIGTLLVNEFAEIISDLIITSQNSIYGMQSFCREHGLNDILWDATDELNLRNIDFVLSRTNLQEIEVMGISNDLSTQGYYICGFTVLFFLIWGVNGCPIFVRRDMSLAKLLAAKGQGAFSQVICEYIAYLLLMATSFLGIAALLGGACEFLELSIPEWKLIDFEQVMTFAVKLLPATAMLTALALLGHELVSDMISGMLLQFLGAIALGYLSGCFYPSSFFSETVQQIGAVLPAGVAIRYASQCMRSEISTGNVLLVLGYLVLFILGTTALRHRKLARA